MSVIHRRRATGLSNHSVLNKVDLAIATLAGLGVTVVHDVSYLLNHPYWVDEAWVAVGTKVPWSELPRAASTTPIGFDALLRLLMVGGDQRHRLIPLAFAGLAVGMAYLLGRELDLNRTLCVTLLSVPVLVSPGMLVRNDLKQYTAEAFWAIFLLWLLLRVEREFTRHKLAALTLTVGLGLLVSNADLFIGNASLLALAIVSAVDRKWQRLREIVLAGGIAFAIEVLLLAAFVFPRTNATLQHYWDDFYLNGGPLTSLRRIGSSLPEVAAKVGLRSVLLLLCLLVLGTIVLIVRGHRAVSLVLPLCLVEIMIAARLHLFPLFDARTSTWLWAVMAVVAGLGIAQLCQGIAKQRPGHAIGFAVLAAVSFAVLNGGDLRSHNLPGEDVRAQTEYVTAHASAGDVIVVNSAANWGFGYYARGSGARHGRAVSPLHTEASKATGNGYFVLYGSGVIAMRERTQEAPRLAVLAALGELRPGGRIFVIRSHVPPPEARGWVQIVSEFPHRQVDVGVEPLLILSAPSS